MDVENAALQERLHEANQERFRTLESEQKAVRDEQRRQGEILARIEANTSGLPKLDERVGDLEDDRNKHRGALWILGVLWTGLATVFGFSHRG